VYILCIVSIISSCST